MLIIGLDQSTTAVGYSIFKDGKLIDYGLIKPKSSKKTLCVNIAPSPHLYSITMPEEEYGTTLLRISAISDVLSHLFNRYNPDVVYFEEIYENRNPKGFRSLARLQGFIACLCWQKEIRYCIKEESTWISYWGTYSKEVKRPERKADIMKKINDLYGLDITIDDISDSIAIGAYAVSVEEKGE